METAQAKVTFVAMTFHILFEVRKDRMQRIFSLLNLFGVTITVRHCGLKLKNEGLSNFPHLHN